MKLFRQVKCSERLPEEDKCVIVIFKSGSSMKAHRVDNGYWFICNPGELPSDCDDPEYWLEPAKIPTDEEIEKDGEEGGLMDDELQLYWEGYKAAIKHLTGGK